MPKIKIVYLIDQLNIGGTENQLLELIGRLNNNRYEPVLVCLRHSDFYDTVDLSCEKKILNVQKLISLNGLIALIGFARWLRKCDAQIVQTFFFDATVFGVCSAKLAGVKKIISSRRDLGFWYTPRLLIILRIINLFTNIVLVNSKAIQANVIAKEKCNPRKTAVIYNGIDLKRFRRTLNTSQTVRKQYGIKEQMVVGIVANLNRPVKRVDLFIRAASEVTKEINNIAFVIVGDGHLKNELMQLAVELTVDERVYFVGRHQDVVKWLNCFDVGVLTSDTEGFSNAILEYLACGLPVVCTDSGGNREIIEDGVNGYKFPKNNHMVLSQKIIQLIKSDSDSLKQIKKNNNKKAASFTWEITILEHMKLY